MAGGCCNIDAYNKPSFGVCLQICKQTTEKPSIGVGDTVKKMIEKVSKGKIKPCGGCKKRQKMLNNLLPYGSARGNDGS